MKYRKLNDVMTLDITGLNLEYLYSLAFIMTDSIITLVRDWSLTTGWGVTKWENLRAEPFSAPAFETG